MNKSIVNFLFELGMLKREKHRGYLLTGLEKPKSVAEHSWRAAIIAYLLAVLEVWVKMVLRLYQNHLGKP